MIRYNLQFFAKEGMGGEKTEPATQKKLSDARKKGQVAKSRELTNGLELLALFLILKFWVGHMGIQFLDVFNNIYSKIPDVTMYWQDTMPEREASILFSQLLLGVLTIIAPILLVGYLIAFLTDVAQVKWKPSLEPMKPKFNKLNPISGFKKIFSVNALVELVKSIAKIALIGYVCYSYLKDKWPILFNLYDVTLMQALELVAGIVTDLGIRVAVFYMVLAFADYAYQKFKFSNDMKMTKQEVKEEFKQQEGDPVVDAGDVLLKLPPQSPAQKRHQRLEAAEKQRDDRPPVPAHFGHSQPFAYGCRKGGHAQSHANQKKLRESHLNVLRLFFFRRPPPAKKWSGTAVPDQNLPCTAMRHT